MKIKYNILIISLFLLVQAFELNEIYANNLVITDTIQPQQNQKVWGIKLHAGTVLVHTKQVENTRDASPIGIEAEYSTMHTDEKRFQKWGFLARNGLSVSYFNFRLPLLGHSFNTAYFVEPVFPIGNKWDFRVKIAAGLSYLTNPYRAAINPENKSYGSHINFYQQIGVGTTWHISKKTSWYLQGNFNHNSNGGSPQPNRGVNYPSLTTGILIHQYANQLPKIKRRKDKSWQQAKPEILAGVFAAMKNGWDGKSYQKRMVVGISAEYVKKVSHVNAFSAGAELYHDAAIGLTKQNMVPADNSSNFFGGISVGHQFLFNKVSFTQQFGYHFIKQVDNYNENYRRGDGNIGPFFQRYGIRYHINSRWKAGVGILARGRFADNIDFRLLYNIKGK
ncbi:MAG: acyloxyacyl hydrolase [Chitinophagaceae bacterium]